MRRSELGVLVLVEAEDHLRPFDHDRPPDEVGVFQHHRDRLLLRLRQPALLEHRAAGADVVEEAIGVDMLLEELARRRFLVDVDLIDVDLALVQKTSGALAGRSGRLRIKRRFRHGNTIIERLEG